MAFQIAEEAIRGQGTADGVTHYSTGVAVVRDGKILAARRAASDWLGGWFELPGGGVDPGETITEGAVREAAEELGLKITEVLGTFDGFDYVTDRKPKVRQVNFLVTTEPGEVVLNPEEHDEYRWITDDEVDGLQTSDEMRSCLHRAFAAAAAAR